MKFVRINLFLVLKMLFAVWRPGFNLIGLEISRWSDCIPKPSLVLASISNCLTIWVKPCSLASSIVIWDAIVVNVGMVNYSLGWWEKTYWRDSKPKSNRSMMNWDKLWAYNHPILNTYYLFNLFSYYHNIIPGWTSQVIIHLIVFRGLWIR